jgi:O-antigen ligase
MILCLYGFFCLSAMAGMNISFLFVFLVFVWILLKSQFKLPENLRRLAEFKRYRFFASILFVACLLSLIVAKFFPIVYANHAPEITAHGFLKIWYLFCPMIIATVFLKTANPRLAIDWVKTVWWYTTIGLGVVAIIQFYTGWPIAQSIPTNAGRFHAVLFFGHHLSTASIIIFPTFVALAQAIGEYRRRQTLNWLAWVTSFAGILILFLTYARAVWISVPIGIVVLFFRYLRPKQRWLATGSFALFLLFASQSNLVKERATNSMGVDDRVQLWIANIDFFKHNPITGIGWLKTAEMSEFYFRQIDPGMTQHHFWGHAHNNFFEMLGGTGLIGLIAFLMWSVFTFKLAYRTSTTETNPSDPALADMAYGLGVGLLLLHINGLTNVTFWEGKVMHQQMLAIGFLLVISVLNEKAIKAQSTALQQ